MDDLIGCSREKVKEHYAEFYRQHEVEGKRRILMLQRDLDELARKEGPDWTSLRNKIELQTKIEELIIKWREAEHDKWKVYGPLVISLIGALIAVSQFGNFLLGLVGKK